MGGQTERSLFALWQELRGERANKVQSLQDFSRQNKELWEDLSQTKQRHLREKKDSEERITALQNYIKEIYTEKDKYQEVRPKLNKLHNKDNAYCCLGCGFNPRTLYCSFRDGKCTKNVLVVSW